MSIPAYPEYADSGFQWLGKVPSSWSWVPFGVLFRRIKRTDHGDEQLLSVYRDYGVIRKSDRDDNFNNASDDLSSYQLVEPGDLAMNKMKAWQGSLGISDLRGIVSPAYFVFSPRKQFHPAFMHYLLRSPPYAAGYMTISKGIRINQWDVDPDHLTSLPVLFPSIAEQQAIAAFLDRETAKIDALVAEQERLIALLKEKRQAVISHAVTKGLNPDTPMKDSGLEWLGEIPAHWNAVQLRRLVAGIEQGWSPQCESRPAEEQEWGVLKAGCVNRGIYREDENKALPKTLDPIAAYEVRPGDVLVSRANGTPELVGSCAFVAEARPRIMLSDKIFRLSLTEEANPRWFAQVMGADCVRHQIRIAISGADGLANNLPQAALKAFLIPLPPLDEQEDIAFSIAAKCSEANVLMKEAETAISILWERRAVLISTAVTGKIDVRGLVDANKVVSINTARAARDRYTVSGAVGAQVTTKLGKFGRMAVMKGGFLAEAHAGIHEMGGRYERAAAGPYSRKVIQAMEQHASAQFGIIVLPDAGDGGKVKYQTPQDATSSRDALHDLVGQDRASRFLSLLDLLKDLNRGSVEAIATLYAAWNDLLAQGDSVNDDRIVAEVLTEWGIEKADKFTRGELESWLAWMRRHGVVPDGNAPRTDHQIKLL